MKACFKELKQRGITVVAMQPLEDPFPSPLQSVPQKPPKMDPRVKGLSHQDIHPTQELREPEPTRESPLQRLRDYVKAKDWNVQTSLLPPRHHYQLPSFMKKYEVHRPSVQRETSGREPYTHNPNIHGKLQYIPSHQESHWQEPRTKAEVYRPSVQLDVSAAVPHTHFIPTRRESATQRFGASGRSSRFPVSQQLPTRRASHVHDKSYGSTIHAVQPSVLGNFRDRNFHIKTHNGIRVPRNPIFK